MRLGQFSEVYWSLKVDEEVLFAKALEINSPDERMKYLREACGDNVILLAAVEELLTLHFGSESFLNSVPSQLERLMTDGEQNTDVAGGTEQASDCSVADLPLLPDRYEPLSELGRGGMGAVWRVRDRSLDRLLAVKLMLPGSASSGDHRARFRREAQITGGLQHPGIPPVIECGELDNGLPFFSMKLVEGRTLAALLSERPEPLHNLSHFLGIFENICQSVGYAHSRGVIHRDLKPANIMVGAFGEVQVMDWGMAKQLQNPTGQTSAPPSTQFITPRPDPSRQQLQEPTVILNRSDQETDDTVIPRSVDDSEDDESLQEGPASQGPPYGSSRSSPLHTQAGIVMGTPSYMSPEQARGAIGQLDARSDVFGLGAILCEILTGKPPYGGKDVWEQVVQANLSHALRRLDESQADHELVDLCRHCLAVQREHRPVDGAVVASAVRHYDEGVQQRLQNEKTDRAAAETRAVEERKRAGIERSKRRTTLALAGTVVLLVAGVGGATWWYQHDRVAAEAAETVRNELARSDIADALVRTAELLDNDQFAAARALLMQADRRLAAIVDRGDLAAQVRQATADLAFVESLDQILLKKATWTKEGFDKTSSTGRDGTYARAFQKYGIDIFSGSSVEQLGTRISNSDIAASLVSALDDWARDDLDNRTHILAIARASDPDSFRNRLRDSDRWNDRSLLLSLLEQADVNSLSPVTLRNLALRLQSVGELTTTVELLNRSVMEHPENFWLHFDTAVVYSKLEQPIEAIGHYQAAIAIRPGNTAAHINLSHLLKENDRTSEAEAALLRAIDFDLESGWGYLNLGVLLIETDRPQEAEVAYRNAIKVNPDLHQAHHNLGDLLYDAGRLTEAEAAFRRSIAIDSDDGVSLYSLARLLDDTDRVQEAESAYRQSIATAPEYAPAHNNLGTLLKENGRSEEAEAAYRRAIAIDPSLAIAHHALANLLKELNREKEAEDAYRKAIETDPGMAAAHYNLANLLKKNGRVVDAEEAFRAAIAADPQLGEAHTNLGLLLADTNRPDEAQAAYRRAIEVDPKRFEAHYNLGMALRDAGLLAQAESAFRQTVALAPDFALGHCDLGSLLSSTERLAEAEASFRRAIAADPELALAHQNLGHLLYVTNRFTEAETSVRRAIELEPESARNHNQLGALLAETNRPIEAEEAFRRAIAFNPEQQGYRCNLADLLATTNRIEQAEAEYRRAIEIDPTQSDIHYRFGLFLEETNQLDEAEAAFREAIATSPGSAQAHNALGTVLIKTERLTEAETSYQRAIELDPEESDYHYNLGRLLENSDRLQEAGDAYQQAGRLNPAYVAALHNVGRLLHQADRLKEAEGTYRRVIELNSEFAQAHNTLGTLLVQTNRPTEAEAAYRRAIEIDPQLAAAHNHLAKLLLDSNRLKEAESALRQAIEADPEYAPAHLNLGLLLEKIGQAAAAEAAYRRSIELDPENAKARHNFADFLAVSGKFKEAEAELRRAITIDPKLAKPHRLLGVVLHQTGRIAEAEVEYRRAITLAPDDRSTHYELGRLLSQTNRLKQAEVAYRQSIENDSTFAEPHCNLGMLLLQDANRLEEAVVLLKRGHALGSARQDWSYPSDQWVARGERLLALDRTFTKFQNDMQSPPNVLEAVQLAEFALVYKEAPSVALTLFETSLNDPSLPQQIRFRHEYNAVCAALLCADIKNEDDANKRDAMDAIRSRKLAFKWLSSNLAVWKQLMESNAAARKAGISQLKSWLTDASLTSVREPEHLARLSEVERSEWLSLWKDVRRLSDSLPRKPSNN